MNGDMWSEVLRKIRAERRSDAQERLHAHRTAIAETQARIVGRAVGEALKALGLA